MKRRSWTSVILGVALVCFLCSLVLPLMRGESPIDLGLDLAGGLVVHYRPDFTSRLDSFDSLSEEELLGLAKEIIHDRLQRRLNIIPEVVVRSDQQIVVSIPGDQDSQRVLDTVGRTYLLSLRMVLAEYREAGHGLFPYQGRFLDLAPAQLSGHMLDQRTIEVVSEGSYTSDLSSLTPRVAFRFSPPHDQAFADLTSANIGRQLAILIDDQVQWVGVIASEIDGVGTLGGGYTMDEAREVATMLRSGSLPLSLKVADISAVGPSLGQELQQLGWVALLFSYTGLGVLLTVAYHHRGWLLLVGLLSLVFLLVSLAGLAAACSLTLDLVGIAGLILSVGMGMDAFLIVFENLERKLTGPTSGKTRGQGLVRGLYSLAGEGRTLLHANATTLIVILLLLSSDRLHSFALFLLVGIFASLLTIMVTRQLLQRFWRPNQGRENHFLSWLRRGKVGVFRWRYGYLAILILALGVIGTLLLADGSEGRGLELGADFRPGSQLVISADEPQQLGDAVEELRLTLPNFKIRHQRIGEPEQILSLLSITGGTAAQELSLAMVTEVLDDEAVEIKSLHAIDERVSSTRLFRSSSVLVLSFGFLALYFLFQQLVERLVFSRTIAGGTLSTRLLVFSGVLLAVLSDLGVVLMVMAIFGIHLNLPVVAAMLTIIGYSVNDSVVLWSHIQQSWSQRHRREGCASVQQVVSTSVDNVLSRACLTSLSTMLPAIAILVLGITPLVDFAWVIIVGTVAGTCSSLFIVGNFAVRALEREQEMQESQKSAPITDRGGSGLIMSEASDTVLK
ncbi:MAG: hypothetical protein GY906_28705 [bacterium]|nr:hypothetical protein [bacterium]